MPSPTKPDNAASQPSSRKDTITTILMMVAALVAIAGFAVLFSLWWRSGVTDPYEILRVAAQEFVAGRPIVAGELAETVRFAGEVEVDPNQESEDIVPEDAPPIDDPNSPDLNAGEPNSQPDEVAEDPQQEWMRLRDFLIAAGKLSRALAEDDFRERRRMLIDAIKPLETARQTGFPMGRQTEGHRMLGEALYELGRYPDAADALTVAIGRDPTLRRTLLPKIAESQFRTGGPALVSSLATIEDHLRDPSLEIRQVWADQLIRIRTLIGLKRHGEAIDAVNRLLEQPPTADTSRRGEEADYRDELHLQRAIVEVQKVIDGYGLGQVNAPEDRDPTKDRARAAAELADPIEMLGELQREAAPRTSSLARLWLARSHLAAGAIDDGLEGLTAVRQQRPFNSESTLAGIEELELLASQGRGVEVLQTTRYMMREIGDPNGFDSDAISFDEFSRRLVAAIEELRRKGDFANAIDTARSLPPVIDQAEALMQEGIGYRDWADATLSAGTDINGETARSASGLSRSRYRAAGDAFAEAAQLKFDTNQYVPTQWLAIEAYQQGRHFRRSIRLLEPYLRYEDRRRLPRGLVAYGRALLAEGDEENAIRAAEACIVEYPRDPLRYDARLLAAQAHAERHEIDQASIYLVDNLRDGELTPQSPAWRDSLIMLGELQFEQAYQNQLIAQRGDDADRNERMLANQPILHEAIRHLEEAVERYGLSSTLNAAYLAARGHMMAAQWPRIEAESPEMLEAAKRSLRAQADQEVQVALESFSRLRETLLAREEEVKLPRLEDAMLRNSSIAEAEALRQMNRWEDAATAYRTVELRYTNEPTALEAILGRSACAKDLGRNREADLLVKQAAIVLSRIPSEWDDRFAETTRFDRPGWEKYLTWMNDRLGAGAT